MDSAIREGGAGGRCARVASTNQSPWMRLVFACALLVGALILSMAFTSPARAAALYECNGSEGETVFTSHPSEYHECRWVSGSRHPTHPKPAAASPDEAKAIPASLVQTASTLASSPPAAREIKANPAVIRITPLQAPSAPVVSPLPSARGVLPIAKPWPMAVMDALATVWLPKLLEPARPQPAPAAPARSSLTQPASPATTAPLSASVSAPPAPKRGAVYRISRKDGTIEYTNIAARAQGGNATMLFTYLITCYACNVHSRVDFNTVALHLNDYDDAIQAAAAKSGVSEALLRAVIHAESGFNPRAMSYKGAQGLMQLMPGTASDMGVSNAFDVSQNISGGAQYLAQLLHDFNGNVEWATAAYNAGEAAVRKYNGVPPYDETQVYVKRVAILRDRYLKALHPAALAAAGVQ